jgi:hypothetical protein
MKRELDLTDNALSECRTAVARIRSDLVRGAGVERRKPELVGKRLDPQHVLTRCGIAKAVRDLAQRFTDIFDSPHG